MTSDLFYTMAALPACASLKVTQGTLDWGSCGGAVKSARVLAAPVPIKDKKKKLLMSTTSATDIPFNQRLACQPSPMA
jgi:hypothetical protein